MRRILRKIMSYIFVLVLIIAMVPLSVSAADYPVSSGSYADNVAVPALNSASAPFDHFEEAIDLKILGLLANSPDDFELGRAPSRVEGAIMLIRLLGNEDQAMQGSSTHPFTDVPSWADKYISYMYRNELSKGIGGNLYGSSAPLSAKQYITFVLRALGYQDGTDFDYNQALEKARELGLLSASDEAIFENSKTFLRDDMVSISYDALSVKMKGSSDTLLDKLVNTDKAIFKPAAKVLGLYTSDLEDKYGNAATASFPMTSSGFVVKSREDLYKLLRKTLCANDTSVRIDIRGYKGSIKDDFESVFLRANTAAEELSGVEYFVKSWKYRAGTESMVTTFEYRYTKSEYNRRVENAKVALNRARYIVASMITPSMSDFYKEKVLHDYIINNTGYDYQSYLSDTISEEAYEEYGCLVLGTAVCEGYAKTMKLLCDLSGLECMLVVGETINSSSNEGHAWNIVRIDGEYYHVDVTYDDPISPDGSDILTYQYFNLADNEMALYNSWNRASYPICDSTRYNYYTKYGMVASNREAFDKLVLKALDERRPIIEIKVKDYSKSNYSNIYDTIHSMDHVKKYSRSINDMSGIIRLSVQYKS